MKHYMTALGAFALSTGLAQAGGFDRSGQGIGFIFEKGNYAELSFGQVTPDVRTNPDIFGNVAGAYTSASLAFKMDVNDKLSLGLMIDQPYGADIDYGMPYSPPASYNLSAHLTSQAITGIARYKFNEAFSVHAGLSQVTVDGVLQLPPRFPVNVPIVFDADSDTGYLVGVAFEKPEIAMRVALTYYSGTDHALTSVPALPGNTINPPQAVNLDFQTGIAKDTLLFGSVRWVGWTETAIIVGGAPIVTYANDTIAYSLGIGRRFTENWSAALTVGYESGDGLIASRLSPTDGYASIGLGATYTKDNMKISAGLRYVELGNATTEGLPVNSWQGNSAVGIGVKIGFTF